MPVPNIQVDSDEEENATPKVKPKPLINMPVIGVSSDESEESESDSDAEDVMTAEEEAAARRYLSGGAETEQRRMSSLDVYLSQPQNKAESMIINRRLSMREEEEQIAKLNAEEMERKEEEERRRKLEREREEVRKERESKAATKGTKDTIAQSPSPRRMTYHKRGFGGLSRERRKKLKEIIMRKAKEELRAETLKEMQKREDHLRSVLPPFNIESLDEKQLQELLKSWHKQAKELEEQRIEWEERLRRQDEEINELTMKLVDIKGKYPMPILRKVPKRENIVARLERLRELNAMHVIKQAVPLKSITKLSENSEAKPGLVNGVKGD